MSFNPLTKFPERYGFDSLEPGISYYATFDSAGNYNRKIAVPELINVDLSTINNTINTHINYDTGIKKTLCEYKNGVKLEISFWVERHSNIDYIYFGYAHIYNGVKYPIASTNLSDHCTRAAAAYYGAKIFPMSTYPQESAVADITELTNITFWLLMPYQYNSGLQSWSHIFSNNEYFIKYEGGRMVENEFPSCFCYGYADPFLDVQFYTFTSLQDLANLINQTGADPISIDDVANKVIPDDDPTQEENPSGPGGGDGTGGDPMGPGGDPYDPNSDEIDFPTLPSNGPLASGAIKAFAVSAAILQQIFSKLWNTSIFDVSTWQKLLEAPLNSVVGLQCVPITPGTTSAATIKIGSFDTEVSAPVINQQYYTLDFGSVKIDKYWGSALDFSPYSKYEIFLPGIGIKPIQVDDAMGLTVAVKYNYDILSGNFVANVKCGRSVLYKFNGNIKQSVPISSYTNTQLESALKNLVPVALSPGTGATGALVGSALNVSMSKTQVQRTGDLSGSTGLLDDFTPYVIVHRPMQSLAQNFKGFKGYPSNITAVLGTLQGYTEVEYIHLTNINGATDTELNEIEQLLMTGVII